MGDWFKTTFSHKTKQDLEILELELKRHVIIPQTELKLNEDAFTEVFRHFKRKGKDRNNNNDNDDAVLSVFIHRADPLRPHAMLHHPMVRMHIVDIGTGKYLTKQTKHIPAIARYEVGQGAQGSFILPIMSKPFDLIKAANFTPQWQEVCMIVFMCVFMCVYVCCWYVL